VSVPVGKPPFELVPYGGYKAKNGTRENTWDESDEEGSQESEDEVIPKVCSALLGFNPNTGVSSHHQHLSTGSCILSVCFNPAADFERRSAKHSPTAYLKMDSVGLTTRKQRSLEAALLLQRRSQLKWILTMSSSSE
jgi:hypothetical protein